MNQNSFDLLCLSRTKNLGNSTIFRLIDNFGLASSALEQINNFSDKKFQIISKSEIEKELELTAKFGAKIITIFDEEYPQILREIPDAPLTLTGKGNLEFLKQNKIAIVGARAASLNGVNFAKKIAFDLGENKITTISGLARGIDTATHEASFQSGTIAVIAGSIDNIYPRENKSLYEKIFEHGLVLTEMPFGAPPKPENFVQRNRIISGLALGVVIVEAGLNSGSLTTARFALEQGRDVFAAPGSPFDPRCQGSNHLIKQGAKLVENIDDILEEFPQLKNNVIVKESSVAKLSQPDNINYIAKEILTKLSYNAILIDEVVKEMQLPAKEVNIALMQLELADKIEINAGRVNLKS